MRRRGGVRLATLVAIAGLTAVAAAAPPGTSSAATTGAWYWSSGLCKSNLMRYGMRLDDGRTFHIAQALCVGKGGPAFCEWNASHTLRLYDRFSVFARSPDGVVRGFDLYPTGRKSYRAERIELASSSRMAAELFDRLLKGVASGAARIELEKGCAPYHY
jgi:hypothetical protein